LKFQKLEPFPVLTLLLFSAAITSILVMMSGAPFPLFLNESFSSLFPFPERGGGMAYGDETFRQALGVSCPFPSSVLTLWIFIFDPSSLPAIF